LQHKFKPRFKLSEIKKWAALYEYAGEAELLSRSVSNARSRGYLLREEFLDIAEWKSRRPRKRYQSNDAAYVEEVSRLAFARETSPRLSIELLTLLDGVSWPTASVFLHFCHPDPYPIIDFRALWSLSIEVPKNYTFELWDDYCGFTREMAREARVDMRTLDRALWQFSKIHEGKVQRFHSGL
jgi:hypothetical protein